MRKQRILFVCHVSKSVGIGHLSRILSISKELKKTNQINSQILIFGNIKDCLELTEYSYVLKSDKSDFCKSTFELFNKNKYDALIFDLCTKIKIPKLEDFLIEFSRKRVPLIAIDCLLEYRRYFSLIWIPCFFFCSKKYRDTKCVIKSGWDSYLLQKRYKSISWRYDNKVLILTGGSDVYNLSQSLPNYIEENLETKSVITWIKGPFAKAPLITNKSNNKWVVVENPTYLDKHIVRNNFVITLYGISFFEVLQYGVPSIVIKPEDNQDSQQIAKIKSEKLSLVAEDYKDSVKLLNRLMKNKNLAKNISKILLKD